MGETLEIPESLRQAIEHGELSEQQLLELIALEAKALGLSIEEAIERARKRTLPNNYVGADLGLLVSLLPA